MRNICCLNQISHYGTDRLTGDYKLVDDMKDAEGILVRSASLHETEFPAGLEAIARAGAGVNNIPLDECAKKGIVVFNTPGANKNGVKELVLAGLFLTSRDVVGGIEWCREHAGEEDISKKMEKSKKAFAGNEIRGKKLGVIGLGAIGCEVANAAAALGMEVYGYDPFISVNAAWMLSRSVKHIMDVNTIYKDCDYITVHVPLLDSTKEMINKDAFDQMKDGVVILNYARDLLVNDDDMAEALKSGKVKKYITDFPNAKTSAMEGVIATPHLGASTEESEDNCAVMAADELKDYLENGNIQNSVNLPTVVEPRTTTYRVCIIHKNIPNMLAVFANAFAKKSMNIENMVNKARGEYAYTVIDTNDLSEDITKVIENHEGVIKARIIAKIVF